MRLAGVRIEGAPASSPAPAYVTDHKDAFTIPVPPIMESIGSLLSGEERKAPEIVEPVQVSREWVAAEAEVWLFLAVSYVHANWDVIDEPHVMIESIFADFDHPDEMRSFIRFMPYEEPGEPPEGYVESRLAEYVAEKAGFYRNRKAVDGLGDES